MNTFLLYSFGMGIFITFVYDLLRIFRRTWSHNKFFVSFEDLLFWVFCAISIFYLMHTESNGTLRWFAILGALTGMFLYKKTISRPFVKWVSLGINWIKKIIGKGLSILGRPFVFLGKKCKKAGKKTMNGGRHVRTMVKKRLTALKKLLKIVLCKQ